jgi:hypothetical protein
MGLTTPTVGPREDGVDVVGIVLAGAERAGEGVGVTILEAATPFTARTGFDSCSEIVN